MLTEQEIRLIQDKTGKGRNCIDEKLSLGDYLPEYKEAIDEFEPKTKNIIKNKKTKGRK